jgi:D-glycero-D-manno-heptose 1,7-bisphosphate phosphatase
MTPGRPRRLVVLDRDGVINRESADFIRTPQDWVPIPGSLAAIARLTRAGFTVLVATNQSGVGRGIITPENLTAIHRRMADEVERAGGKLGGIFACTHHPDAGCECRKPRPGLLRQIEQEFAMLLRGQPVIGDSLRDLEAAIAVGALPVLVRTGNGRLTELSPGFPQDVQVFDDLAAATDGLLATGEGV